MTFGQKLKYCRKTFGYTQKELAEKLYVTPRMIGYYEHDEKFPGKDIILNISSLFKVPLEYLLVDPVENPGDKFFEESYSVELNRYKSYSSITTEKLRMFAAGGFTNDSITNQLNESIQKIISFTERKNKRAG